MRSSLVLEFSYFSATGLLLGHFKPVNYASRMDSLHMFSYQHCWNVAWFYAIQILLFCCGITQALQTGNLSGSVASFERSLLVRSTAKLWDGRQVPRADYPKNDEKLKRKMPPGRQRKQGINLGKEDDRPQANLGTIINLMARTSLKSAEYARTFISLLRIAPRRSPFLSCRRFWSSFSLGLQRTGLGLQFCITNLWHLRSLTTMLPIYWRHPVEADWNQYVWSSKPHLSLRVKKYLPHIRLLDYYILRITTLCTTSATTAALIFLLSCNDDICKYRVYDRRRLQWSGS
jgi:hypothetical protein